jgi:hypothetical protein
MRRAIVVLVLFVLVGCGGNPGTPTPAARGMSLTQMTGADWLTLSFDDRLVIIKNDIANIRCPSAVTPNDITISVTQAANTSAGRTRRMYDLLVSVLAIDGCVQG